MLPSKTTQSLTPIVDLFAGPGGLGEGFSSIIGDERRFLIALSIEKDFFAHKTLSLRAFYRWFFYANRQVPKAYYRYLAGEISYGELFEQYPDAAVSVKREAIRAELGNPAFLSLIDRAILSAVKRKKDWLLIGGPPCQAYSLVGRSRMQNAADYVRKQGHAFEDDHRHKLYQQYLRIISMHKPAVFVMENVKGILSAKLEGERIFPKILADLRDPSMAASQYGWAKTEKLNYRIVSFVTGEEVDPGNETEYLIRTEQYGIPQSRHRVILLGIREDVFKKIGGKIKPLERTNSVTLKSIIGKLPALRSGFSKGEDGSDRWMRHFQNMASARWIKTLDDDIRNTVFSSLALLANRPLRRVYQDGGLFIPQVLKKWYIDNDLKGIPNHETRSHMEGDLARYLFVSAYGKVRQRSPHLIDFPRELLPDHKNVDHGSRNQKFSDRFKVQLWNQPASTVTSHISKDGHYFIHPDSTQCRSITVREAARIQTFPDNYYFEGGRTQQYHQVGNAVPPLLANQLAEIVYDIIKKIR